MLDINSEYNCQVNYGRNYRYTIDVFGYGGNFVGIDKFLIVYP